MMSLAADTSDVAPSNPRSLLGVCRLDEQGAADLCDRVGKESSGFSNVPAVQVCAIDR